MTTKRPPAVRRCAAYLLPAVCVIGLLSWTVSSPATAADRELRPAAGARPHTAYTWKSDGGLRYQWCLPEAYDPEVPRDLTVILHGTGLDYRWGFANHGVGAFRPDDIVVSVDGTSPGRGESRLFLGDRKNAASFRDFLEELRDLFAVRRVFLYGHSQGGFFVVYYAGEHPDTVDGVVAHASGSWSRSNKGKSVRRVAVAFLHGTADPVVTYRQSPPSRDAYVKAGFDAVHLRRLIRYNHWPNAVRAGEALAWCSGMVTDDPAEALAAAVDLLRPKPADAYRWTTVVGFAGARDVLDRFDGKSDRPLRDVDEGTAARAARLADAIDAHASRHVKALERFVSKSSDLELDGKPWLGHLVSLREDFRGVDCVEEYVAELGYDKLLPRHAKAAGNLLDIYYSDDDEPAERLATVATELPRAFLFEGLPPDFVAAMEKQIDLLKRPTKSSRAAAKAIEAWSRGWDDGLEHYEKLWRSWKLPAGFK